jgi:hypothetical protein
MGRAPFVSPDTQRGSWHKVRLWTPALYCHYVACTVLSSDCTHINCVPLLYFASLMTSSVALVIQHKIMRFVCDVERYVEGSGRGLFWIIIPKFTYKTWRKARNISIKVRDFGVIYLHLVIPRTQCCKFRRWLPNMLRIFLPADTNMALPLNERLHAHFLLSRHSRAMLTF